MNFESIYSKLTNSLITPTVAVILLSSVAFVFAWVGVPDYKKKLKFEAYEEISQVLRPHSQGFWVWRREHDGEPDGLYWDDSLYSIFGVSKETFTPSYESFLELVHPEDRERVDSIANAAMTSKSGYSMTFRIILPETGEIRVISEQSHVAPDGKWMSGKNFIINEND